MDCVFFDSKNGRCITEPSPKSGKYKPEDEIVKKYCKMESFENCARLNACLRYLRALHGST